MIGYDFYFADKENHCIRILTPDGVVSTFAGRGSASASSYKWGKQNGEVRERARFNQPVALAYDEVTRLSMWVMEIIRSGRLLKNRHLTI